MKRDFLKDLGIADDAVINKILDENSADVGKMIKERDGLKAQLTDVQTKLAAFDGVDVNAMKGEITKLQNDLKAKEAEYQKQIDDRDFNDRVKTVSAEFKPRDLEAVRPFLKIDELKASKNQEADIRAAFENVKKEKGYLFDDDTKPKFTSSTGGSGSGTRFSGTAGDDKAERAALNAQLRSYLKGE